MLRQLLIRYCVTIMLKIVLIYLKKRKKKAADIKGRIKAHSRRVEDRPIES